MKATLVFGALSLLSFNSFASTFSCSDYGHNINFYFTTKSEKVAVNPNRGEYSYSEQYSGLSASVVKRDFLSITDENGYVNLQARFNRGTYVGRLQLAIYRGAFDLQVICNQVN